MTKVSKHPDPVERLKHMHRFTPLTIDEAPESAGLYAWYGTLDFGPKDWELDLVEGVDHGLGACRTLLQGHTTRFVGPPLRMAATGTFATEWRGDLRDVTSERLSEELGADSRSDRTDAPSDERVKFAKLHDILESPAQRSLLLGTLQAAVPVLSAPLYIGVAESLRVRLRQHVDQLFKLSDAVKRNPKARTKLINREKSTFASRAISLGFTQDTIEVWALGLESLNPKHASPEQLRTIAEAAEWLLNRWHRPLLGKR